MSDSIRDRLKGSEESTEVVSHGEHPVGDPVVDRTSATTRT
jgi:hypothetical protein